MVLNTLLKILYGMSCFLSILTIQVIPKDIGCMDYSVWLIH